MRWKFHDHISNGLGVITLTDRQTHIYTNRHHWEQYHPRRAGGEPGFDRRTVLTTVKQSYTIYSIVVVLNPPHNCDKTCNKSCNTCTSLAALVNIMYNIMQELATCRLQPITAYRPIDGIRRLLTQRVSDSQAWDVAPPISLQLLLQLWCRSVASCLLRVVTYSLQL